MNQLYPYQIKGVEHLLSRPFGLPHALLADAPGTGKTIMTIEAAKAANCKSGVIIVPPIIKEQWKRQMVSWNLASEDEIQTVYGLDAKITNQPWTILNYELARETEIRKQLLQKKFNVLIMDEAHKLKSHSSLQTHAVFHKSYGIGTRAFYKWALSGTIMPNRPVELYPILKTMAPAVLGKYNSWDAYKDRYCGGYMADGKGASNIDELTAAIQPFMLRRDLPDVWQECPPVIENTVYVDVPFRSHPEWIEDGMYESTERRIIAESKIPQMVQYIRERFESGVKKLVVFTYHTEVIKRLSAELDFLNPVKIYGEISARIREENILKFTRNADCGLLLAQIASAGEAIDGLQHVASECIAVEPEWSPGRDDQAIRRLMRLGQTKPVIYTKLLASNSYEDVIQRSNTRKRKVINVVLKPNGGPNIMAKATSNQTYTLEQNIQRIADAATILANHFVGNVSTVVEAAAQAVTNTQPIAQPVAQPAPPSNVVPMQQPVQQLAQQPSVEQQLQQTVPNVNATTSAPLSAPSAVPAATTAVTTASASRFANRMEFDKAIMQVLQPMGQPGLQKLATLNAMFGVDLLRNLPEARFDEFYAAVCA